ncbi:MAG: VWA domain-containing protein [Spirochaetales bacterium]|nr:VWA domain-containing protein [Spirochaetales bacterium]
MGIRIGDSLSGSTELFNRNLVLTSGTYTLNASSKCVVLSFVDVLYSNAAQWMERLQNIKDAFTTSIDVVCVLYLSSGSPSDDQLDDVIDALTITPSYIVVRDIAYASSAANTYRSGLSGTIADPCTYLLAGNTTIHNLVTDKFHYNSTNNGHGTRIATLVDNDFLNLDWGSVTDPGPGANATLNKMSQFIIRRMQDLQDNSPSFTLSPNAAAPVYATLPSIQVTYSRKAFHAQTITNYTLSGGVTINNISPAGQINWSSYRTGNEVRTLNLNAISTDVNTTLSVAAAVTDTKTTAFGVPSDTSYHVDPVHPTVTSITGPSSPTNTVPITITVIFSEPIKSDGTSAEFTAGDIGLSAGWSIVAGTFNSTLNPVFTFQIEPANPASAGTVTVTVNNGVCQDLAGNTNSGGPDSLSVDYDPVPGLHPLISIAAGTSDPTNASPIPLVIDFQEAINPATFSSTDLTDNGAGGSFSTPTTSDNRNWNINYSPAAPPAGNGLKTLGILPNTVQDPLGNQNAAASCTITYDGTPPTVQTIDGPASPTNTLPMDITVTFSEEIKSDGTTAEFTESDIGLSAGWSVVPLSFNPAGNPSYTFQITKSNVSAADTAVITIANGVCEDLAGNPNGSGPATHSIDYDPVPGLSPILSITESSPTNAEPVTIYVDFQEAVDPSTFEDGDLNDGGAGGTFDAPATTDNIHWTVDYHPVDGPITITLPSGAVEDPLGNSNPNCSVSFISDRTSPFPVIDSIISSPTYSTSIPVTITFVSGEGSVDHDEIADGEFVEGDITLSAGWHIESGSFSPSGNPVFTFDAVPDNPASTSTLQVSVAANICHDLAGNPNDATTAASGLTIDYEPEPATDVKDIMLCVDFSNSMNDPITIDGVPGTKISFVKEALDTLGSVWSSYGVTSNYGLAVYRSLAQDIGSGLKTFDAATLATELSSQFANGNTAMGAGLAIGLHNVDYSNASYAHDRAIILFADGQNNVSPFVSASGTSSYSIPAITGTGFPSGMSAVTVNATDTAKTPIYTVGIGTNGGWLDLLSRINQISGAAFENATELNQIWPNVENGLTDILDEIFYNSSPQKIYNHYGSIPALHSEEEESYVLNKGTKRVIICVSWPGNNPVDLEIWKGSTRIDHFTKVIHKNKHSVYVIDFPHYEQLKAIKPFDMEIHELIRESAFSAEMKSIGNKSSSNRKISRDIMTIGGNRLINEAATYVAFTKVDPEGTWNVLVKRREDGNTCPYNFTVIADEKNLKFKVVPPRDRILTGNPFTVYMHAVENGLSLDSVIRAQVDISAPATCYGNVVDIFKDEIQFPAHMTQDEKLAYLQKALMNKKAARAMLEKREHTTKPFTQILYKLPIKKKKAKSPLTETVVKRGYYQVAIPKQTVPGIYRLNVTVKGMSQKYGVFQRTFTRDVMVDFNFSLENSEYSKTVDPITHVTTINVFPRDIFGNILGPGYSDYFRDNLDDSSHKNIKITDHLNGRYTIVTGDFIFPKSRKQVPKEYYIFIGKSVLYKQDLKTLQVRKEKK